MYRTVNEIFDEAAQVSDELAAQGRVAAAEEIRETLRAFWTTSTEALGELRTSLSKVASLPEGTPVSADLEMKIEELQRACTVLMDLA